MAISEDGFKITVFPAASVASTPPAGIATGKFHSGSPKLHFCKQQRFLWGRGTFRTGG